jgi:hypothetical protein
MKWMLFTRRSSPFDYFQESARMSDYSPKYTFTLGLWTVGKAGRALKYEWLDPLTIDLLLGTC